MSRERARIPHEHSRLKGKVKSHLTILRHRPLHWYLVSGPSPVAPLLEKGRAMGNVKSLVLAGMAAFVIVPGAYAADLGPGPILPSVQAPALVEDFASGWYLRGDVGVGSQRFKDFEHHQTNSAFVWPASWRIDQKDIKDTAFVGFGVGYQWNAWLRTDVTGEYRQSSKG